MSLFSVKLGIFQNIFDITISVFILQNMFDITKYVWYYKIWNKFEATCLINLNVVEISCNLKTFYSPKKKKTIQICDAVFLFSNI